MRAKRRTGIATAMMTTTHDNGDDDDDESEIHDLVEEKDQKRFRKRIPNDNSGPGLGLPAETIENDAVFDRFGAAERFQNFAERFRNRSAKFRNRSAQSLSETQRKMSSRFALTPLKGQL